MAARLTPSSILMPAALLTAVIEGIAVIVRFGLGFEATRDTRSLLADVTFGVRIHHSYIGVVVGLLTLGLLRARPAALRWGLVLAIALIASDLIHHFIILWIIVGDPEFHLVYPGVNPGG